MKKLLYSVIGFFFVVAVYVSMASNLLVLACMLPKQDTAVARVMATSGYLTVTQYRTYKSKALLNEVKLLVTGLFTVHDNLKLNRHPHCRAI